MADTEKITINLSVVDLGRIDLLVEQGFYSTRTDFIRTAIRKQSDTHQAVIDDAITRRAFGIGVIAYSASDLKKKQAKNEKLNIRLIGLLFFQNDITPKLALATIESISVFGTFRVSPEVRKALGDRITN